MYDILIENGQILDGTGSPWFQGDMGLQDGKIVKIGTLKKEQAKERLNVQGLTVSPGFIDIHTHADALPFLSPREEGRILQGITTDVIGNCGVSLAPVAQKTFQLLKKYTGPFCMEAPLPWDWQTVGDFLKRIEEKKSITNVGTFVGHGAIRIAVMGVDDRHPTGAELGKMKELVAQALDEGAVGLSSGLIYPPGVYSDAAEMIELCKVVAEKGGFYITHMRNEYDLVVEAVKETIEVAEKSGVPTIVAHHKTAGKKNWGRSRQTLTLIEGARGRGIDIICEAYPYTMSSTFLHALLPPWVQEGGVEKLLGRLRIPENRRRIKEEFTKGIPGWANLYDASGWDGIIISSCRKNKDWEGKKIQEIAAAEKTDPAEMAFDILLAEDGDVLMILLGMAEEDVTNILKHPLAMVGSDSLPGVGKPHPRFFGAFPRILRKYVREDKSLSLPEAIRKMTSMPAQRLGFQDRGLIREGMGADITIFDPATIEDKATVANPRQNPVGIHYVLVNGQIVVRDGRFNGTLAGKVLRKVKN
jgi:N-acyl-D-amino-acid deacylase